jgi:hypothetical protein
MYQLPHEGLTFNPTTGGKFACVLHIARVKLNRGVCCLSSLGGSLRPEFRKPPGGAAARQRASLGGSIPRKV